MCTRRSFVIEFDPASDVARGRMSGWVAHVGWGDRTRFASVGELLSFLGDVLGDMRDAPPVRRRRGASAGAGRA